MAIANMMMLNLLAIVLQWEPEALGAGHGHTGTVNDANAFALARAKTMM